MYYTNLTDWNTDHLSSYSSLLFLYGDYVCSVAGNITPVNHNVVQSQTQFEKEKEEQVSSFVFLLLSVISLRWHFGLAMFWLSDNKLFSVKKLPCLRHG